MNGKEIIKKLKKEGWQVLRIRGSHHMMGKGGARTTVPVHAGRDLKPGLVKKIQKDTGVKLT